MSTINLKPELLHVLTELPGKSFTVAELTKHYIEHPGSLHKEQRSARQFTYRNMVRMMKVGLMDKLPDDGGWPKYQLTQKFKIQYSNPSKPVNATPSSPPNAAPPAKNKPKGVLQEKPLTALRERLSKHRSDMLCAVGEAEEYESLCKDLPEFAEEAQSLYAEARERSALILGKIKALESLLSSNNLR